MFQLVSGNFRAKQNNWVSNQNYYNISLEKYFNSNSSKVRVG